MATLTSGDLKIIRDIYAKKTVHRGVDGGADNTACWNWALSGIVDQLTMVRPEKLCDFVSRDSLNEESRRSGYETLPVFHVDGRNGDLNAQEIAWFGDANNLQSITAAKVAWMNSRRRSGDVLAASKAIAKLAINANGLNVVDHATSYKICVYYYDYVTQPNFQHWWIEVEGVWFELFPGLLDIQIARDAQKLGGNKVNFSHYVVALHQSQVDRIHNALQGYDGQWWSDHSAKECSGCQIQFAFTTRRHHCRGCGEVFCDGCTSQRKVLAHVIRRPGSSTVEQGMVRVCDDCFANAP